MEGERDVDARKLLVGKMSKPCREDGGVAIMSMFVDIGKVLYLREVDYGDVRHISRQITWESKKAVSQVVGYYQNFGSLQHAELSLDKLLTNVKLFPGLAKKLARLDAQQYSRCYSPALQEYTEAYALLVYFKEGRLLRYEEVEKRFTYKVEVPVDENSADDAEGKKKKVTVTIPFSKTDFYLGLADIPGELVRACAAGLHTENFKFFLFSSTDLVRGLYMCLQAIYPYPKALSMKVSVMRASLIKLETACYHMTIEMDRFVSLLGFGVLADDAHAYDEEQEAIRSIENN